MSETQNPHRRPLAPGEIRTQWVGNQLFQVMHVSGGSFTQASVRASGQPTQIIATEMFEQDAVRAYAEAIEQAESDATVADDVAALRSLIAWHLDIQHRTEALETLDRIAGAAPLYTLGGE